MTDLKQRKGTFTISRDLIDTAVSGDPDRIMPKIFADVIVVRAEMIYMENAVQYWGYSPKFEVCSAMVEAPTYLIEIHVEQKPDRKWHTWKRL